MEALMKIFNRDWFNRDESPDTPKGQLLERFRGVVRKNHFLAQDNIRISKLRFVVLDTETTGFKPHDGDELLSVGAVVVKGSRYQEERFDRYVNPRRPVPPVITDLTGISDEMVSEADDFCDVMVDLLDYLQDSIIVGHCIGFDLNFLNCKLKPYNIAINNYCLDIAVLSKIFNPGLQCHSLDSIIEYLGKDPAGRHTAIGDALLTADIFLEFLQKFKQYKINTLWDLRSFIKYKMYFM